MLLGESCVVLCSDILAEPTTYNLSSGCGSSDSSILSGAHIGEAEDGQEGEAERGSHPQTEVLEVCAHLPFAFLLMAFFLAAAPVGRLLLLIAFSDLEYGLGYGIYAP